MKILSLLQLFTIPFGYVPCCPAVQVGYPKTITAEVTAYCPCEKCCGKFADGTTASGRVIFKGDKFCAADKSIPFGTMITIPDYGTVPVLDRGGAITGSRIDVFFPDHQQALNWGRRKMTVKIWNYGVQN